MMGWDPDKPAYFPDYKIKRDKILKGYIKEYFGNQIRVTEGFYSPRSWIEQAPQRHDAKNC